MVSMKSMINVGFASFTFGLLIAGCPAPEEAPDELSLDSAEVVLPDGTVALSANSTELGAESNAVSAAGGSSASPSNGGETLPAPTAIEGETTSTVEPPPVVDPASLSAALRQFLADSSIRLESPARPVAGIDYISLCPDGWYRKSTRILSEYGVFDYVEYGAWDAAVEESGAKLTLQAMHRPDGGALRANTYTLDFDASGSLSVPGMIAASITHGVANQYGSCDALRGAITGDLSEPSPDPDTDLPNSAEALNALLNDSYVRFTGRFPESYGDGENEVELHFHADGTFLATVTEPDAPDYSASDAFRGTWNLKTDYSGFRIEIRINESSDEERIGRRYDVSIAPYRAAGVVKINDRPAEFFEAVDEVFADDGWDEPADAERWESLLSTHRLNALRRDGSTIVGGLYLSLCPNGSFLLRDTDWAPEYASQEYRGAWEVTEISGEFMLSLTPNSQNSAPLPIGSALSLDLLSQTVTIGDIEFEVVADSAPSCE